MGSHEQTAGEPSTRRYSPEEKAQAVRLVRQLRAELGTSQGDSTYPASHGCVRVPMHIAEHLPDLLPDGTPVGVYRST